MKKLYIFSAFLDILEYLARCISNTVDIFTPRNKNHEDITAIEYLIDDPINTKQFYVDVAVTNPEVITNAGKSYQILDDTKTITVTIKARRKVLDEIKSSYIMATADLREMQDSSVPIRVKVIGFE